MMSKSPSKNAPVAPPNAGPSANAPAPSAPTARKRAVGRSRERLVMIMMGLVTAAFAASLYAQFGYAAAAAVLAGAGFWIVLAAVHTLSTKSDQVDHLKDEVHRLEDEIAELKGPFPGHRGPRSDATPSPIGPARTQSTRAPAHGPAAGFPAPGRIAGKPGQEGRGRIEPDLSPFAGIEPDARWEQATPSPRSRLVRPEVEPVLAAFPTQATTGQPPSVTMTPPGVPAAPQETSFWPGTSVTSADPLHDPWSFRPKEAGAPPDDPPPDSDQAWQSPAPAPAPTIDAELEMVQRKIKALADEVNAAEAMRAAVGPKEAAPYLPSAIDQSVGALKAASHTMRDRAPSPSPAPAVREPAVRENAFPSSDFFIPATAERIAASAPEPDVRDRDVTDLPRFEIPPLAPAPVPVPDARVAAIASAIRSASMDVFLSPIVGLKDHAVAHYEVAVRLKSPTGGYLDNPEDVLELAGSDLLGLFDSARLTRGIIMAGRLDARGKRGSVMSAVAGQSMTDAQFLETFARHYEERQAISGQLVLCLSQSDISTMSPSAWQALDDMHAFGFRFAIDRISHLDTDFELLASRGFAFVKLPAQAFVTGLPYGTGTIPASDICRHLAGSGLTLVAEAIDDDNLRARVFGFGVLFGQGQLFGGPRPVSLDVRMGSRTAAA